MRLFKVIICYLRQSVDCNRLLQKQVFQGKHQKLTHAIKCEAPVKAALNK